MYCGNGKMKKKSIEVVGYLINWMISVDSCGDRPFKKQRAGCALYERGESCGSLGRECCQYPVLPVFSTNSQLACAEVVAGN